jgi:hypothetical protein
VSIFKGDLGEWMTSKLNHFFATSVKKKLGGLNNRNYIMAQFWRLEIRNQDVSGAFLLKVVKGGL